MLLHAICRVQLCDLAVVWLFLVFVLFLHGRIRAVTAKVDAEVITAADYAIYVQGLPQDATEDEVGVARGGRPVERCQWRGCRPCRPTQSRHPPRISLLASTLRLQVRDHFSKLYDLRRKDWTFPSTWTRCCWTGRKMTQRRRFHPPAKSAKRDASNGEKQATWYECQTPA